MRSAASYSTWFNGGIRTTSYFHNQIGILTETIGNPTPIEIPFVPDMQLPRADVPNPIAPQPWHFRQSIEYSMTTNYAILDIASEAQGGLPLQHVPDGEERDRHGQPRPLDDPSEAPRRSVRSRRSRRQSGGSGRRRRAGGVLQRRAARSRRARSARLHPAVGSARLPDRDEVRQHPDQGRRRRAPRHGAVHGRRQVVSGRVVRRQGGAAVPRARDGHVRAAGSSERHPVSGRPAAAAVRRHRLQPGVLDGDRVRSHPRRLRRPVREGARRRSRRRRDASRRRRRAAATSSARR